MDCNTTCADGNRCAYPCLDASPYCALHTVDAMRLAEHERDYAVSRLGARLGEVAKLEIENESLHAAVARLQSTGGWEVTDDGTNNRIIPLTSDGQAFVSALIARAEKAESLAASLQRDLDFARDIARLVDAGREETAGGAVTMGAEVYRDLPLSRTTDGTNRESSGGES